MRLQAAFDIVDDELVVNVPKQLDRDLHFRFTVPSGYCSASRMPKRTPEAWLSVIGEAGRSGQLRRELVDKILTSLGRMPDLQPGQQAGICFSGGKDSAAITLLARMRYPKARLFAMFADTQDEWPETYTFIPVFMAWADIEDFRHIETMGIHRLLEERMPFWPIAGRRHCTKNVKLLPMRDHLDEGGFDQVRKDGKPARYRKTHERQGASVTVMKPTPLLLSGERQIESLNRAGLPIEPERDEVLMRMTVRPVIEFSIIDMGISVLAARLVQSGVSLD